MAAVTFKQSILIAIAICVWSTLLHLMETYKHLGELTTKARRSSDKLAGQIGLS